MPRLMATLGIAIALVTALVVPVPQASAQLTPQVVISEVHYHPQSVGTTFPDFDDREDTEFIELLNLESTAVDLGGWCLDSAVEYCFPAGTSLASSSTVVIADSAAAFGDAYGFTPAHVYSGKLSNGGEQVRLVAGTTVVFDMTWQTTDPWPVTPDGNGPSLELQSTSGDLGSPANWAASSVDDGTPGSAPTLVNAAPPLVTSHVAAELVASGQAVAVSATAVNTTAMTLVYNIDYGSNQTLIMSQNGGSWETTLPPINTGGMIQYRFEASGPGGVMTSPRADDVVNWWAVAVASPQPHAVPVVDLFFSPQAWDDIDDRVCGCTGAVAYEGQIWTDVTMRRAGNTSINQAKAHLRLDFPDGHPFEASFLDGPVDELTLDAGFPNYDMVREQLSWDVMDAIGFPTIQTEHVRVHQRGDFHGLYLLREEQDGNWRARNDLDRGAFYKVDGGTDSFGFSGQYTKKEGLDEADTDLINLATCVQQTGAALRTCLNDTTDVPQMINEFASMIAVWQTDQREFNFFLYRDNTQNRLWRMLPDDLDRTWGNHNGGSGLVNPDTSSAKIYRRCIGTDPTPANEICRAFMNVPEFKDMYLRRIRTLTDEVLADPVWKDQISTSGALIAADWNDDDARWNRTSYSLDDMLNALDGFVDDYVAHLRQGGHEGNVPAAQTTAPQVSISDYRSDPGDGLGYLLITNPSASESVDLSNWKIDGLAEIGPGLVVLPGATVAVTTNDQLFRSMNPSFSGVRTQVEGTLAGQATLLRRDGSTAAVTGQVAPAPIVLTEWNAVASANTLVGGDATLGSVPGNGGDWFELAVIDPSLDVRGWRLVLSDNDGPSQAVRDEFVFSNDPLLSNLEGGTIITVSESFADDTEFLPAFGDWHINLQANSADQGAFFTAASQSNFDTNHQNWQLSIFDDNGALVFGPAGEGIGAASGINSSEVGELEADPSAGVDTLSDYGDGNASTFGQANVSGGVAQDYSALRYPYVFMDVNCNGRSSVADALAIARFAVGNLIAVNACPLADPIAQIYVGAADVNRSGDISVLDALLLLQCNVGNPNEACPD